MSEFNTNLLTGIATDLHNAGIGTWNASGVYTTTQTAIVLNTVPQGPDRIICLTTYTVQDSADYATSVIGLQVRTRWGGQDPRLVQDLDDLIFSRLHGRHDVTLTGGVVVGQILSQDGESIGQDANLRWERTHNYYLTVFRPTTYRH